MTACQWDASPGTASSRARRYQIWSNSRLPESSIEEKFPDAISEAAKLSGHGQKWLTEQQKNTFNEQQQEAAAENERKTAGAPPNGRASKKARKSYDDEDDEEEL